MTQHVISSQILIFRSLLDFTIFIKNSIDLHNSELTRYEAELGLMLRQEGDNSNEEWAKEIKEKLKAKEKKLAEGEGKGRAKEKKEHKSKKEKRKNEKDWLSYKDVLIFAGNATKGKTDLYFGAVDELKAQIDKLRSAKEMLDQMISSGISNLFYLAYVRNGIPEKLVLIPQEGLEETKFEFKADFTTGDVELPIETRNL